MRKRFLMLFFVLVAPACHAIEPYGCRNGFFPAAAGTIREAIVQGGPDGHSIFRSDAKGCPDDDACLREPVQRGVHLLVSMQKDSWSCAWLSGRHEETVGWLPSAEVAVLEPREVRTRDWIGRWEPIAGGGDRIDIATSPTRMGLRLRGKANWVGGIDGFGERVVHFGRFTSEGSPVADILELSDGECVVRMQWVARSLVVADNAACGGVNVRFDGVYRLRSSR